MLLCFVLCYSASVWGRVWVLCVLPLAGGLSGGVVWAGFVVKGLDVDIVFPHMDVGFVCGGDWCVCDCWLNSRAAVCLRAAV